MLDVAVLYKFDHFNFQNASGVWFNCSEFLIFVNDSKKYKVANNVSHRLSKTISVLIIFIGKPKFPGFRIWLNGYEVRYLEIFQEEVIEFLLWTPKFLPEMLDIAVLSKFKHFNFRCSSRVEFDTSVIFHFREWFREVFSFYQFRHVLSFVLSK